MINRIKSLLLLAAITVSLTTYAQKSADPQGALTYCLPSTTVTLEVTALQECFYAGPYAKFADKYFGVKAKSENSSSDIQPFCKEIDAAAILPKATHSPW